MMDLKDFKKVKLYEKFQRPSKKKAKDQYNPDDEV